MSKLNSYIDPAVDKYNALEEEQDKMDFKLSLEKFMRLYAFLTHVIRLNDEKLHKFEAYGKCLWRKIPKDGERNLDLGNDVMLHFDLFKIVYNDSIMDVVLNRMNQNQEFCVKYLEDEDFRKEIDDVLLPLKSL